MQEITKYILSAFLIYAGITHFTKKKFFLKAMPSYIPKHEAMVIISGIAEIVLGLGLLIRQTQSLSAWGIILLLIAVFPANVYMLTSGKFHRISKWFLIARLPLQFVLIWWAYQYT